MTGYQYRYVAYAKDHDLTPAEIMARDTTEYPWCHWWPFHLWIQSRWQHWAKITGHKGIRFNGQNHQTFDQWLGVDNANEQA